MRASLASGGKSLSQYSQFGRSSSAMSSPEDARASNRGLAARHAQPKPDRHVASSMPLQNRVDPFGELHAVAEHGGLMGNRGGRLHRDDQTLSGSRWKTKHWLICVCEFKGRRRDVWGRVYTELFFLDEPTALAAGHRPCFECRRQAAKAFIAAFPGGPRKVDAMDEALHRERVDTRRKRVWRSRLGDLPDGAMIARERGPCAVRSGALMPWSFAGYGAPAPLDAEAFVDVLTPPSTVATLKRGYEPLWPDALKAQR